MNRTAERTEFLTDVLIAAVEGGVNYWAQVSEYDHKGGTVTLWDMEDEAHYPINLDDIARGVRRIEALKNEITSPNAYREIARASRTNDAGEIDASSADVIVQAGIFGKVVYG